MKEDIIKKLNNCISNIERRVENQKDMELLNDLKDISCLLPDLLASQKQEILVEVEKIEIPYGCLQVKEQLESLKKQLT